MAFRVLDDLDCVVERLCPQCTPRYQRHQPKCLSASWTPSCQGQSRDADRHRTQTLASLCQVSRQLSALATPHLYHRPTCAQWPLLARTLLARPDIATCVRHLCNRDWVSLNDSLLGRAGVRFPSEVLRYWNTRVPYGVGPGEDGDRERVSPENIVLDVVLSLCPELVELDAVVGSGGKFSLLGPQSPQRLRSVALAHWNKQGGFCLAALRGLTTAAPGIHTVIGWQVSSCKAGCNLGNVTHLRLGASAMPLADLRTALRSCPRLESLEYSAGGPTIGDEQFTPREIQDALVEEVPRLKSLVLDLDGASSHEMEFGEGWVLGSLAGLRELRRLGIDTRCLVPHKNLVPIAKPDPEALVRLLPESIYELEVWQGDNGPDVAELGAALAELAMVERFEGLARVSIRGKRAENLKDITPALETKNKWWLW